MYKNILKEESERILFQYFDEYKNALNIKQISIDDFLKSIEIDIEASESYDYYSVVINNHFKNVIFAVQDIEEISFEYYKDFYKAVKEAFVKELKDLELEYISELSTIKKEFDYFKDRLYINEELMEGEEPVSEEERFYFMEKNNEEMSHYDNKIRRIRRAIY